MAIVSLLDFAVSGLSNEQVRGITTDPILIDTDFADYRKQTTGVHCDVSSTLLTIEHRTNPLRRVSGCDLPQAAPRPISQRTFIPRKIGYEEKFCIDVFRNTILALMARQNLRENDLTDTVLQQLLIAMVQSENKKHLESIAWFADEKSSNVELNQIDGYWKLIQEAIGEGLGNRVSAYSNTPLGAGDGVQILRDVVDNAPNELAEMMNTDKVIYIDRNVWNRLKSDIQTGLVGSDMYEQTIVNGVMTPFFDGIELRVKWQWAGNAISFFNYTGGQTNLVAYFAKNDFTWALNEQDLTFEAFYSRDLERYIMRNKFVFGAQIDHPQLMSVAY